MSAIRPSETIQRRMKSIRHKIAVLSGKGGVGKSTVSTNLAYGLALRDYRVGILDVDIHGPNIGKMLGIEERRFSGSEDEIEAVEVLPNLKAASVGFVGYDPRAALIWRGPMKLGIIKQFLEDVVWGELDYMVIDTPPGTGDEPLTICQYLPELAGAVVVSTPQDVALLDAQKSVDFAAKMKIPVLGIIENMRDPENGPKLFGSGGGERAAEKLGVPFLGAIPLDPGVVESGDSGRPIVASEAPSSSAIAAILNQILDQIPVS